jgi:hypothetical protein
MQNNADESEKLVDQSGYSQGVKSKILYEKRIVKHTANKGHKFYGTEEKQADQLSEEERKEVQQRLSLTFLDIFDAFGTEGVKELYNWACSGEPEKIKNEVNVCYRIFLAQYKKLKKKTENNSYEIMEGAKNELIEEIKEAQLLYVTPNDVRQIPFHNRFSNVSRDFQRNLTNTIMVRLGLANR